MQSGVQRINLMCKETDKNWRFGVAGNIVSERIDDEGILRYGTKTFTGGTKVYINGNTWSPGKKELSVIGRNRFGRYVYESVPVDSVEHIRCQRIYKPVVLEIIDYDQAVEGTIWWGRTASDRRESEAFVKAWKSR